MALHLRFSAGTDEGKRWMLTRILLTFTQDEEEVHLFSISVIDLVCKGSGERIASVCLMKLHFFFFFFCTLTSKLILLSLERAAGGGVLLRGPLTTE